VVARQTFVLFILLLCVLKTFPVSAAAQQNLTVYDRLERAAELIRKGELARAEAELNIVLRTQPREANALNLLGVVRAEQQRTVEAEKLFLRAVDAAPTLLGAYLNLGQLYEGNGKADRAFWAYAQASKLAPDRHDIDYRLAGLYAERRDYKSALEYLEKIPQSLLSVEHLSLIVECYLGLGRVKDAEAVAASLVQTGSLSEEAIAALASSFAEHKLPDRAVELLEAARQRTPNSFPILYNLATIYYQKAELSRAEKFYTAGLRLKPDDVLTLRALARVARAGGELEKALAYLIRARKIAPDSVPVLYDFGWTALNLNLIYDALPVLKRLHQMQPDEPGYLYALGIAYLQNGEAAQAQPLLNRFIDLRPADSRGYYVLGAALYSVKQYPQARAALERSLSIAPYADAEYYLGMIAHNEGDSAQAVMRLQSALKSEPNHQAAHAALGMVYAKQKNYEAARSELERAIALDPKDGTATYQLGLVYARTGEKERAQAMFAAADKLRSEKQKQEMVRFRLVDPPK